MGDKIIYDIETLRNTLIICFYNIDKNIRKSIVVHENESCVKLVSFLNFIKDCTFIGYNNLAFDAQILEYVYHNPFATAYDVYNEAQRIIELKNDMSDKKYLQIVPEWKLNFKQRDIYKIKNYDSMAKLTSLKFLEFSFRQNNVLEMPIHHSESITVEQIPIVVDYCWNDIDTTLHAWNVFQDDIISREQLSAEFDVNVLNASEPRVVKTIFLSELARKLGTTVRELKERNEEYKKQVKPFKIKVPDWIQFEDLRFQRVKQQFEDTLINPFNTKKTLAFNYKWRNIDIHHGLGGLHACVKSGVYKADNQYIIRDYDKVSFYPFIKIRNGIFPPYYGKEYLDIYEGFFHKRKLYPKSHPLNAGYKLMLNGSFGLMNEYNSPIYYPKGAMFVTITGQLILLYWLEQIMKVAPETIILQCNTDGITLMYYPESEPLVQEVNKRLEELTQIGIEEVSYSQMIIRDVNSYISVNTERKVKLKGVFEIKKDYYKNSSFTIIPIALEKYFVHGQDFRKTILEHDNIYDFLGVTKKKSNFDLNYFTLTDDNEVIEEKQQRITRYFISTQQGGLVKQFKDKKTKGAVNVESGWNCTTANLITSTNPKDYPINYTYYIKEVEKIINSIEGNANQLTLF